MKYLRRYLSLLFALVMCVGLFSVTAHAEAIDDDYVYIQTQVDVDGSVSNYEYICYPQNGTIESTEYLLNVPSAMSANEIRRTFYIAKQDKSHLFVGGRDVTVRLENVPIQNKFVAGSNYNTYYYNIANEWSGAVFYTDNSSEYVTVEATQGNDGFYDISFSFAPEKDVQQIYIYAYTNLDNSSDFIEHVFSEDWDYDLTVGVGEVNENSFILSFEQDSKEVGLLSGILGKLTEGFSALGEKISSVVNGILELPQKLWSLISDGLKGLFVPSEDSMTAYKDKWDELLASRFGAVYQVVNIITDSWDGIMQADETNTIEFPQVSINFSGTPFVFGGYTVSIVPDGFDVLVTAIKAIVAIVCTVAFVNGMRKRYDEIMGVEQ